METITHWHKLKRGKRKGQKVIRNVKVDGKKAREMIRNTYAAIVEKFRVQEEEDLAPDGQCPPTRGRGDAERVQEVAHGVLETRVGHRGRVPTSEVSGHECE